MNEDDAIDTLSDTLNVCQGSGTYFLTVRHVNGLVEIYDFNVFETNVL
jgi:hypothetical protein